MSGLYLLNGALTRRAKTLIRPELLQEGELYVIDSVAPRFSESDPEVLLGLAFALRAPRVGDVGVDLRALPSRINLDLTDEPVEWPDDLGAWESAVLASSLVGGPSDLSCPFASQRLNDGRTLILTRKMWREQERLAASMAQMAQSSPTLALPDGMVQAAVIDLFGESDSQGALAVKAAASGCLTVVTGGPGTGKTYSIKRLLALLVEQVGSVERPLRIELAAPTGKAAVRMAEAIAEDLEALHLSERVHAALSGLQPKTLHRLLGIGPSGTAWHGLDRPILADLVVVDEASMVDLGLMRRLFEAIPPGARLVLLGDRDQLASVDAGTVLADMVGPVLDRTCPERSPLARSVVPFLVNHRFRSAPTVASIASALQARGDDRVPQVRRWMTGEERVADDPMRDRVVHLGAPVDRGPTESQRIALAAPYLHEEGVVGRLATALRREGVHGEALRSPRLHRQLLDAFADYRVLAVHREGALGVTGLERSLVKRVRHALRAACPGPARWLKGTHWLGRAIMITRNAYDVGLMNGDIGLVLPSEEGLVAVFEHKGDERCGTRTLALSRLPEHMGAFAMTVHKSQGSQFKRVAMVLAGQDSPIQTRELLYTAITRSSQRLDWLGDPDELERALRRRVGRASGLADLLWRSAER